MKWENTVLANTGWSKPIDHLAAKQEVAEKIASKVANGDIIGFGSGSTSFLAIKAIAAKMKEDGLTCTAIPTSLEVSITCMTLGIPTVSLMEAKPSWAFDGADEVDPRNNLIKGRGGAMFREKLLLDSSPKNYILVDQSKLVTNLGEKFPVPIEVFPLAVNYVLDKLSRLGATELKVRLAEKKDGPVITESGNLIIDARFADVRPTLELELKQVTGVIESGLFLGRDLEILVSKPS